MESHSLYAVLLYKQAGIEGSPGRERKQYADRSAGSVKHVGERLSWKFSFIIHTLHADTNGQHIQIIIYENQKTKNKCRKQGLSFGVTQLTDDFLETVASFRSGQQCDQPAEHAADDYDVNVVCQTLLKSAAPLRKALRPVNEKKRKQRA